MQSIIKDSHISMSIKLAQVGEDGKIERRLQMADCRELHAQRIKKAPQYYGTFYGINKFHYFRLRVRNRRFCLPDTGFLSPPGFP